MTLILLPHVRTPGKYRKIQLYDVKVKSQEKALSLVNMHIQPQDHCAAPKEMLRAWYLGAGF